MNLKERLVNTKKNNILLNQNGLLFDGNCDVNNFFIDKNDVKTLLSNIFSSYKNIIYVCNKNIDNSLIANYFYSLSNAFGATIVDSIEKDIENFHNRISIIPNPNINEVVKIFEYILYGYKSFVFGLNFDSNPEILNKLITVIAINYPNLSNINIETLLGFSNSLFVYFEVNDDGLYYISEINELNYENEKLSLTPIFVKKSSIAEVKTQNDIAKVVVDDVKTQDIDTDSEDASSTAEISIEQPADISLIEDELESESDSKVIENKIENVLHCEETIESDMIIEETAVQQEDISSSSNIDNSVSDSIEKKVNKYKLLKEKVKNKRNI